jgi:hypothetical protein
MAEFDKREDGTLSEKGEEQMKAMQFEYISFVYKTMAEMTPEDLADMIFNEKWYLNENLIKRVNGIYQKLIALEMPLDTSEHSSSFGIELLNRVWKSVEMSVANAKETLIQVSVGNKDYRDITLKDVLGAINKNTEGQLSKE